MNAIANPNPATTVMIIDDDEFSRDVLSEMLTAQGVSDIHSADSGRMALQILAGLPKTPDVLICDVFMPDMDGIEFMSTLASQSYRGGVILVSGVDIEMLSMARDLAAANGIKLLGSYTKPLHQAALAQALASCHM
jgi:CheY-like chemotaxis protein